MLKRRLSKVFSVILAVALLISLVVVPGVAADPYSVQLLALSEIVPGNTEAAGKAVTTITKDTSFYLQLRSTKDLSAFSFLLSLAVDGSKLKVTQCTYVDPDSGEEVSYYGKQRNKIIAQESYTESVDGTWDLYKGAVSFSASQTWKQNYDLLLLKVTPKVDMEVGELPNCLKFVNVGQKSGDFGSVTGTASTYILDGSSNVIDVEFTVCPYGDAAQKSDAVIYNTTKAAEVKDKFTANAYDASGKPVDGVTIEGIYTDAAASTALKDDDLKNAAFPATTASDTTTLDVFVKTTDGIILPATLTITDSVKEIYVAQQPSKLEYKAFEVPYPTGMTVKAKWYSGKETEVDIFTVKFDGAAITADTKLTVADTGKKFTVEKDDMTAETAAITVAKADAPEGITLAKSVYYKLTAAQTITAGEFTGWPEDAGTVTFKANSSPSTVTGEAAAAISATGFANGSFTLAELENTDLVDKTATWTVQLDSENYETATATITVTLINKTPVTFQIDGEDVPESGLTAEYTGSALAPVVTLKGLTMAEGGLKATWTTKAGDTLTAAPKDAGEYVLKLSYDDNVPNGENNAIPGYHGDLDIPVIIAPKPITVKWSDTALTYTGAAQKPTAEVDTGLVSGDTVTLTVSGEQTNANREGATYSATAAIDGNTNYVIEKAEPTQTTEFTIAKAPLTVTAKAKTIVYGDAPANDGVEYSGFVNDETEAVLTTTGLDYDYTYTQYGNVGAYDITPKGLSAENYDITYAKGTLTVEQKAVGFNWGTLTFTYTGNAQAPAPTATGLVNDDACALTVEGSGTDVGKYTAKVTALDNDNYKLPADDLEKDFEITKAEGGVSGTAAVNVYHGTADAQTILITDFVFKAGEETITLAGAAFAENQTGAAALGNTPNGAVTLNADHVTFTLDPEKAALDVDKTATWGVKISSTNYKDFEATVTLTVINKEKVDITIDVAGDTVYGGQYTVTPSGGQDANGYTVTYSGTPDDGSTFTAGTEAPTKAGVYTITVKYEDDIAHDIYPGYVGSATKELKIEKATVTITASSRTIEIGNAVPDISAPVAGTDYRVEGLVGEDKLVNEDMIALAYDVEGEINNNRTGRYAIVCSGDGVQVPSANYNAEIVYKDGALNIVDTSVPVSSLTLNKDTLKLEVGAAETLTATVEPSNATVKVISWVSSDPAVATVGSDGTVTAVSAGTATIKVTVVGAGIAASCEVTVTGKAGTEPGTETGENVITVAPEVTGGAGAVEIPEAAIKEALENKEADEPLSIVVDTEGAKELETTIPADALKEIAEAGIVVSVQTELATVNVSPETLKALADQGKDATVTVKANENGSVTVYLGDSTETAEDTVKLALPEAAPGDVLAIIEPDGTEKIIKKSVTEDGKVYADVPTGAEVKVVNNDKTYADVAATAWYKSAVDFVSSHDLFQGTDKGFEPNLPMSRAMLAMVFCRLEDGKAAGKCPLSDVPETAWYADAAAWVVEAGIMIGTDKGFEPNTNVTREQMATTLYRYAKYLGMDVSASSSLSAFSDGAKTASWAKEAMSWAVAVGLFEGDDTGALNPGKNATRAEVAKLFRNMIELIVK